MMPESRRKLRGLCIVLLNGITPKTVDFRSERTLSVGRAVSLLGRFRSTAGSHLSR